MTCCLPSSPESNPTSFDVIDFKLEEDLSRPFRLPLKLSSYDPINNFIGLLDTSALLTVLRDDEPVRYVQVQRDYTFTHPAYRQEHIGLPDHIKHQANEYERFDYPGRYKRDVVAKALVHARDGLAPRCPHCRSARR